MDEKLATTIGKGARAARVASKLTQEDAADATGVSPEFYARIERGKTLPSVPTLVRMVQGLGVSADVLLGAEAGSAGKPGRGNTSDETSTMRQVTRRLRRAQPSTVRLVSLFLREIETASKSRKQAKRRR